MGEIETNKPDADDQEQTVEEETDTSENNDGADDDAEEGDDADDNNDDGSDDEEETDDDEDETDDKKSKKSTSKDEEDKEPPVRKRPSDFAKERIERKKSKSQGKDDADTGKDDDEDDDIDPADEKTVGKIVEKALKPFIEKQMADDDDKEVKNFLKDNPDFAKYEAKARKYMAHPSRKDVPVQEIFYGVAGKDLMAIGAKRKQIADKEAKKTKSGGGASDAGGVKPVADLTREELEAKQAKVRAKLADR